MTPRRWPWLLVAALLLLASGAVAFSTSLYWLPCRGSMLNGSVLRGHTYGPDFSEACLRRMDDGTPFANAVAPAAATRWVAGAAALLGLAWLVMPMTHRWG